MKAIHVFFSLCIFTTATSCARAYQALIITPIADLAGQPLGTTHETTQHTLKRYKRLTEAGSGSNPFTACPRTHQALFNEIVQVHQRKGNEVCVTIPNVFYQTRNSNIKNNRYWTHHRNIISLTKLEQYGINTQLLPHPIAFSDKRSLSSKNTVTLIRPWYSAAIKQTFSAGTRFICAATNNTTHTVYIPDIAHQQIITAEVPRGYAINAHSLTRENKAHVMVKLLRSWTQDNNGFIPYVWGGSSYTTRCTHETFKRENKVLPISGKDFCFTRHDGTKYPKSGMDCTGLVARAAQICGIPYFSKNSTTVTKQLKPLTNEPIENGDIIWVQGHVMVVSDVNKNLLIEARGYPHGFGKVQEMPLNKVFKKIHTYNDLLAAHHSKKSVSRLNKKGLVAKTNPLCTIYKLKSVWA